MVMDFVHATGSKLATALGMTDSETSDAVYITGMSASRRPTRFPHLALVCFPRILHLHPAIIPAYCSRARPRILG